MFASGDLQGLSRSKNGNDGESHSLPLGLIRLTHGDDGRHSNEPASQDAPQEEPGDILNDNDTQTATVEEGQLAGIEISDDDSIYDRISDDGRNGDEPVGQPDVQPTNSSHPSFFAANECVFPPIDDSLKIDRHDDVNAVFFFTVCVNPDYMHDPKVNECLYSINEQWDTATIDEKQSLMKTSHFISPATVYTQRHVTAHSGMDTNGRSCIQIAQHPLLAYSSSAKADCLLSYYHCNKFKTYFDLSMGKFDVSDLWNAAHLLPINLLQALFA